MRVMAILRYGQLASVETRRMIYNPALGTTLRLSTPITVAVLLLAVTNTVAAQHCSDIATVQFRNSVVTSVHDVDEPLKFKNGIFDGTPYSPSSGVEWRYEIVRDTLVRPDAQTTIRFIEMFKNHLNGTGSWKYLVGFRCSGGMVTNVFQQAGAGMQVVSLSPDTLHLRFPLWKPADSQASPSGEKDTWFSWNTASHLYVETHPAGTEHPAHAH
jgi:hypothetical protein